LLGQAATEVYARKFFFDPWNLCFDFSLQKGLIKSHSLRLHFPIIFLLFSIWFPITAPDVFWQPSSLVSDAYSFLFFL
jgi:hypothetical protein